MSIRRCLILGCMVVGLQVLSAGQDQPSQNPPAQNPGGDNSDSGRTAPAAALSAIAGMQSEGGTAGKNER